MKISSSFKKYKNSWHWWVWGCQCWQLFRLYILRDGAMQKKYFSVLKYLCFKSLACSWTQISKRAWLVQWLPNWDLLGHEAGEDGPRDRTVFTVFAVTSCLVSREIQCCQWAKEMMCTLPAKHVPLGSARWKTAENDVACSLVVNGCPSVFPEAGIWSAGQCSDLVLPSALLGEMQICAWLTGSRTLLQNWLGLSF